jgi:LmbE family N-acetylglucosaminyl deacetylase
MNRRDFLKSALALGAFPAMAGAGCVSWVAPVKPDGSPEPEPLDDLLEQGARVMWVAAHPDDECFSGSILARASIFYGNPVYLLVLTHGDGGECGLARGCHPDLATVRGQEMAQVALRYRAQLQHERLWNAPLPVSSFPPRHEIYRRWREALDPVALAVFAIRRFRPDVLLTFEPTNGATGHPEHQLASRIATTAVRLAAEGAGEGPPHRVKRTYYLLNRSAIFRLILRADPGPVTETFDATLPCRYGESCLSFMLKATRLHRTQKNDMGSVREHPGLFERLCLRQVDPWSERHDPDEPV